MRKIYTLLVLIMSLVFISCSHGNKENIQSETKLSVDVSRPVVDSVVIHKSFPGYLTANTSLDIVARVNGYLDGKYFNDGDIVEKGEVLFHIEDTQYRDKLQQAEAQLQTAIATNAYATKHYEAMKKAALSDAVSQMDVIQAESAMNESKAAIESAKAAVQTARTILSYCTVKSPIRGRVAAPTVTIGNYISGDGSPFKLTTVYDDDIVNAHFSVNDNQYLAIIDNLRSNKVDYSNVPVQFGDSITSTYTGELAYIAPNIVTNTGTIDMKVNIDNPEGKLKAGMYALIYMPVATDNAAIMVKDMSIGTDQLGKYLYVVNDSNKVVYTAIETGELVNDSTRIVTKGLEPNQCYVTKALLKVRSGMTVNPVLK